MFQSTKLQNKREQAKIMFLIYIHNLVFMPIIKDKVLSVCLIKDIWKGLYVYCP